MAGEPLSAAALAAPENAQASQRLMRPLEIPIRRVPVHAQGRRTEETDIEFDAASVQCLKKENRRLHARNEDCDELLSDGAMTKTEKTGSDGSASKRFKFERIRFLCLLQTIKCRCIVAAHAGMRRERRTNRRMMLRFQPNCGDDDL